MTDRQTKFTLRSLERINLIPEAAEVLLNSDNWLRCCPSFATIYSTILCIHSSWSPVIAQSEKLTLPCTFRGSCPIFLFTFSLLYIFVSAPECQDIETALYDHMFICMYIFSVLCSIFQYVIKQWLHTLELSGSREHKSDYGCLWIYLPGPWIHYQD